jgi:hypothetical protein
LDRLTNRHIQTAERNRAVAHAHLDIQAQSVQPPAFEWAAVIAFYSAVHYVNGYLWEVRRYAPPDHQSRNILVNGDPVLQACRNAYDELMDSGYRSRYTPGFRLLERHARELVDVDLEAVRRTVREALGLPLET